MPKEQTRSKKIRDLKRLLQLTSLPETTRNEKERALAALQSGQTRDAISNEAEKMANRYKMVKFFEARKAVRRLRQAKKALAIAQDDASATASSATSREKRRKDEEVEQATKELQNREVDVKYIEGFPVLEKYISLYKDAEGPGAETTRVRRDEIWKMAEAGTLQKSALQPAPVKNLPVEEEEEEFFE